MNLFSSVGRAKNTPAKSIEEGVPPLQKVCLGYDTELHFVMRLMFWNSVREEQLFMVITHRSLCGRTCYSPIYGSNKSVLDDEMFICLKGSWRYLFRGHNY